jgi:hypothetical protein
MCHIHKQKRPALIGNGAEAGEIELAGVGRVSGDKKLGFVLKGQAANFVVIDQSGLFIEGLVQPFEPFASEACLVAVSEVTTMTQVEP